MPQAKAAPRSRGAAARSEVNGKVRHIELSDPVFKGLEVEGSKVLPATFSWDLAALRAAKDEWAVMGAFHKLIVSVVGEVGIDQIRDRIVEKAPSVEDGGGELMSQVVTDIIAAYGTDAGES